MHISKWNWFFRLLSRFPWRLSSHEARDCDEAHSAKANQQLTRGKTAASTLKMRSLWFQAFVPLSFRAAFSLLRTARLGECSAAAPRFRLFVDVFPTIKLQLLTYKAARGKTRKHEPNEYRRNGENASQFQRLKHVHGQTAPWKLIYAKMNVIRERIINRFIVIRLIFFLHLNVFARFLRNHNVSFPRKCEW